MTGRSIVYNIIGAVVLPLISLLIIPPYIKALGVERFGLISLIWLLFGYFGLFDFGLSRATANSLAKIGDTSSVAFVETVWTSLLLNLGFGLLGAAVAWVMAPFCLSHVGSTTPGLKEEALASLPWIVALIPLATLGGVFNGVMEASGRFLSLNVIQVVGTLLFQPLPLLATLYLGANIKTAVIATTIGRAAGLIASGFFALKIVSFNYGRPRRAIGGSLLAYGGWITVTNVISPVVVSADQFLIGALSGPGAVTYYAVPFNFAMKILILPASVTRVLFPRLSSLDKNDATILSRQACLTVGNVTALICAPLIILAHNLLQLWLGDQFAFHSDQTARVLLLATWINSVAFVPFSLLQSQGRPDLTAKIHALEVLPFLVCLYFMLSTFGLTGAALAWGARVLVDLLALLCVAGYRSRDIKQVMEPGLLVGASLLISEWLPPDLKFTLPASILVFASILAYAVVTDEALRRFVLSLIDRLTSWKLASSRLGGDAGPIIVLRGLDETSDRSQPSTPHTSIHRLHDEISEPRANLTGRYTG